MGRVIGIDLGTTNTAIAVLEDGRPRVLEDDKGYAVIPSCIATKGEGNYVVGYAAKNLILTHPDRTVYGVKRLLGQITCGFGKKRHVLAQRKNFFNDPKCFLLIYHL